MRLVAMMLARNSGWVIGASARSALLWCDHVVVLAHACYDDTVPIVQRIASEQPGAITLLHEASPVWDEMEHRERVMRAARDAGATHVANVDDDEILTSNYAAKIRGLVNELQSGEALDVPWLSMWGSIDSYRDDDSHWSRTMVDVVFRLTDDVHYSAGDDGYQHHARRPRGSGTNTVNWTEPVPHHGGLMHLQFCSKRRLLAKQALYKIWERLRWPTKRTVAEINAMYDGTAMAPGLRCSEAPASWWRDQAGLRDLIRPEDEPWQELECRRLFSEHAEALEGLDLYGVV